MEGEWGVCGSGVSREQGMKEERKNKYRGWKEREGKQSRESVRAKNEDHGERERRADEVVERGE